MVVRGGMTTGCESGPNLVGDEKEGGVEDDYKVPGVGD